MRNSNNHSLCLSCFRGVFSALLCWCWLWLWLWLWLWQDFLNGVCTNIIVMQQRQMKYWGGNYDTYQRTREEQDVNQVCVCRVKCFCDCWFRLRVEVVEMATLMTISIAMAISIATAIMKCLIFFLSTAASWCTIFLVEDLFFMRLVVQLLTRRHETANHILSGTGTP